MENSEIQILPAHQVWDKKKNHLPEENSVQQKVETNERQLFISTKRGTRESRVIWKEMRVHVTFPFVISKPLNKR